MSTPEANAVRVARRRFAIFFGVALVALIVGMSYSGYERRQAGQRAAREASIEADRQYARDQEDARAQAALIVKALNGDTDAAATRADQDRQTASQERRDAEYKKAIAFQAVAESICADGIKQKMSYLEPIGEYSHLGPGALKNEVKLRVAVRLSDSFRADPVGVVECSVDTVNTGYVRVTKIRM